MGHMSVTLSFLGAARKVTGSQYLIETEGQKILVDCGMSQDCRFYEGANIKPFVFEPSELDAVLITHAHMDHTGKLPKLVKEGYRGSIYSTPPTKDFAEILLRDAAELMLQESQDIGGKPLYFDADVTETIRQFKTVNYREETKLAPDISFRLLDAGHVLGSSIIELKIEGKTIVFSGDLGNPPTPLLKPTEAVEQADYVIIESTYGNKIHEVRDERNKKLETIIEKVIANKGVLMMPVFAFEKEQEILFEIDKFVEQKQITPIPVFIDSPLAIHATKIYERYPDYYNVEAKKLIASGDKLFSFPGMVMTPTVAESKQINGVPPPKIIIAGSGMMIGGRILHHAVRYLSDSNSVLLFMGYQAAGSLGRRLFDGARSVRILGQSVRVNALVKGLGAYSSHADQEGLVAWLDKIKNPPKNIFVTHGEEAASLALVSHIKEFLNLDAQAPFMDDKHEL